MVFVELATTITTTMLFKRDVVMHLLAHIAPEDSASRRRNCQKIISQQSNNCKNMTCSHLFGETKGPNYVWHTDGMDKLKPYGFAVHGCIDGCVDCYYS